LRHGAAQSLRDALGPPSPRPATITEVEPEPALDTDAGVWTRIPLVEPEPEPVRSEAIHRPPDLAGVSFVLLLGADNRTAKVTGRTDSMILAGFRHRDGAVAAFSVPRDLWVPLPDVGTLREQGRTHARISSVMRVGEVRVGRGQGMALLRQTLHEQLGIRVDRYAVIDFAGFVAMVDAFDGIEVDVECPIMDCFWTAGPNQPCEVMSIDAGRVHMDGATALQFVRSRHGTGDHDRTKRQQAVLLGFSREVRARGLRGLPELWRRAEPFVTTDLDREDAAYYASFALDNQPADVHGFAIRHPMTARHVTEDGKHVLLLDREAFDRALDEMFEARLPALSPRKHCPEPDAALQ
jgi:LCP family protein required for cell wall assembly